LIRNRVYDAVESPPVPRQPPHEITLNRRCAWELAAFAASCRNGLMTLFNGQSDCMETDVQMVALRAAGRVLGVVDQPDTVAWCQISEQSAHPA
jgi:hypothetical protein